MKPERGMVPDDKAKKIPPAGPHASDDLTDKEKTPGAGSLPEEDSERKEVDPGTG